MDWREAPLKLTRRIGGFPNFDTWGIQREKLQASALPDRAPERKLGAATALSRDHNQDRAALQTDRAAPEECDGIVSVQDVLNTRNLNDRMEMARLRHTQIRAQRGAIKSESFENATSVTKHAEISEVHFANTKEPKPTVTADSGAVAAYVTAGISQTEKSGRQISRGILIIATFAVLALAMTVSVPGPLRNYLSETVDRTLSIFEQNLVSKDVDPVEFIQSNTIAGAGFTPPNVEVQIIDRMREPTASLPGPSEDGFVYISVIVDRNSYAADLVAPTRGLEHLPFSGDLADGPGQILISQVEAGFSQRVFPPAQPSLATNVLPRASTVDAQVSNEILELRSTELRIDRDLHAPFLRASRKDVRPSPLLGRLVPNYIISRLPSPVAMAAIASGPEQSKLVAVDAAYRKFEVSSDRPFAPSWRKATLSVPSAPATQSAREHPIPLRVTAPFMIADERLYPVFTWPNNILMPLFGPAPRRLLPLQIPERTSIVTHANLVPDSPAAYVNVPVGTGFELSNFLVNFPSGYVQTEMEALLAMLSSNGFPVNDTNLVDLNISKTNVRYFNASDADAARVLADLIDGRPRSFTDFLPRPPEGTIEVWMAGNPVQRQPVPSGRQSAAIAAGAATTPKIIMQKNRLLDSFRDDDQLK